MSYVDNGDDELDYEDEDYPETGQTYPHASAGGAIAALTEDELQEEEEEDYEDLYQDVDVGFFENSGSQQAAAGRFPNSSDAQNGAEEGYGEEEYAEEYEGGGRNRSLEEESYPGEQEYGTDVVVKTEEEEEEEFEHQDYEELPTAGEPLLQPKEEEIEEDVEQEAQEDGSGHAEMDVEPRLPRPKQPENLEVSSRPAGPVGGAAAAATATAVVKSEERDYSDTDPQAGRATGTPALLKPKVEVEFSPGSSQQQQPRTELQVVKPAVADRGNTGGARANGSGPTSSEGGGGVGRGASGSWSAAGASRGSGGGAQTQAAVIPAPQSANREPASSAADYTAKHGQQHEAGGFMLFVGELHWWTTDAELEAALSEYGRVKNVKFFEEKASGRSKGYCQVEFYDHGAARVCKEKMDGRVFNERPCVVAFASSQTIKQMGAAQVGKNMSQTYGSSSGGQGRGRTESGGAGARAGGTGSQAGEGGRGYGREKMPMGGRGGGGPGPERGRGSGRGGRGGNIGGRGGGGGAHFPPGPPGPMGGGPGGMMPPQGMMGGGFDPAFGPPMGGRGGGGYGMGPGPGGGFGPRAHPFGGGPGMGPPFPAMGPGLPGVAPHVNPAFFGRANGNGPGIGMDGPAGAWGEGVMPGWVGDEHERRMVYGEEMGGPDYGYPGEMGPDRLRAGPGRERERGAEGDWAGVERRRREDRGDGEWGGDRHRDRGARDEYWEREQGREKDKDWPERERAPRGREKPRAVAAEEEERPRSRDEDFGKRRRMVADRKIER